MCLGIPVGAAAGKNTLPVVASTAPAEFLEGLPANVHSILPIGCLLDAYKEPKTGCASGQEYVGMPRASVQPTAELFQVPANVLKIDHVLCDHHERVIRRAGPANHGLAFQCSARQFTSPCARAPVGNGRCSAKAWRPSIALGGQRPPATKCLIYCGERANLLSTGGRGDTHFRCFGPNLGAGARPLASILCLEGILSWQAATFVTANSKHKGSYLLTLLMIANHAHADGTGAWPSIATLSKETRMSERGVQYCIQKLKESGELAVIADGGPKGVNGYCIVGMTQTLRDATSAVTQDSHPVTQDLASSDAIAIAPKRNERSFEREAYKSTGTFEHRKAPDYSAEVAEVLKRHPDLCQSTK